MVSKRRVDTFASAPTKAGPELVATAQPELLPEAFLPGRKVRYIRSDETVPVALTCGDMSAHRICNRASL